MQDLLYMVQVQLRKHVLHVDHAGYTTYGSHLTKYELVRADQGSIFPRRSRSSNESDRNDLREVCEEAWHSKGVNVSNQ